MKDLSFHMTDLTVFSIYTLYLHGIRDYIQRAMCLIFIKSTTLILLMLLILLSLHPLFIISWTQQSER